MRQRKTYLHFITRKNVQLRPGFKYAKLASQWITIQGLKKSAATQDQWKHYVITTDKEHVIIEFLFELHLLDVCKNMLG
jgi:hypothetical protein